MSSAMKMTNNITHTLQLVVLFCCWACLKLSAGTGRSLLSTLYDLHGDVNLKQSHTTGT